MCEQTNKQLKRLSSEFVIIILTLFIQSGTIIWWAATTDNRVMQLEREVYSGGNTAAHGAVRDERINTLTRMVAEQYVVNRAVETKLGEIAEDVAVLRGEGNRE